MKWSRFRIPLGQLHFASASSSLARPRRLTPEKGGLPMSDQESDWDDWFELLFLLVVIAVTAVVNRLTRLIHFGRDHVFQLFAGL